MPIKAIIFDMDGVLIEAKDWHYDALNQALELFGYTIDREAHLVQFDGLPTKVKLEHLSNSTSLPASLHSFINQMKQQYTLDIARSRLIPDPIQIQTMSLLKAQGYTLGVASNSVRATVDLMMDLAGLSPFLNFTLSNNDVTAPKPSPEIYQKAMQLADVQPHECLVLEDNPFGWRAATGASAHLLQIADVKEVNYENIHSKIEQIAAASQEYYGLNSKQAA